MKLLQSVTGKIEKLTHDGSGAISRPEGKPVLVYNTIPGETVKAKIFKRSKEGLRAELEEVIEPSSDRVTPRCPYAGKCGGCKWQHAGYDAQLKFKLDDIIREFAGANVPCPISSVEPAPEQFFYRNRMDYVFGKDGELGLKQPGKWWATLDLETCFLLSEDSVEILKRVRDWTRASGLPFWNAKTQQGFFRYLVIREGKNTGERLVMLVTAKDDGARKKLEELPSLLGDLATSVVWGINPTVTDLSVADEIIPLKGEPFIHETVGGISYKITPNAFFQTNSKMAERLQAKVAEFCGDLSGKTLLDLYCGSGFFSLKLAGSAKKTVGIELSAEAIECAKENAAANGVTAEYFASPAEDFDWKGYAPDVVILDPPRAGMHPRTIETVMAAAPKTLVYVSCNYLRFLQEWKELSKLYVIDQAAALDLFPHTPHMECVFRLTRKAK
jgi:23S rRNA (uracil-5-)-methyltransferase RumA